jgi:CubicO group peptidase (beta-lactamase class C family)
MAAIAIGLAACGAQDAGSGRADPADRDLAGRERVDALLGRLADYDYAGSVAFGDEQDLWFAAAYGRSDRERGLPFEAGTAVDIGSLTKPFTAALILVLEGEGLVSVDDPLARHFPDVPPDKANIRVHQLLTHTSGLLRTALALGVDAGTDREAFVDAVLSSELLYPPGERFEYSDTGYDLLAALVEIVTGEPYADALERRVLRPAGLRRTGYSGSEAASSGPVADSYTAPLGSPWYDDREGPSEATWYNRGSGGLISTVADLQRFVRALRRGDVLDPGVVARMMDVQVEAGPDLGYGYGWYVRGTGPQHTVFHGGDIAGYKAHLEIDLGTGRTVAALDNVLGWERVTDRYVLEAWDGGGPTLPPPVRPSADPERTLAGTYRTEAGDALVLWEEAGVVGAEARGQPLVDLLFGVSDDHLQRRTADSEGVMRALAIGDTAFLNARMRDRDRIAGMPRRLVTLWGRLERDRGAVDHVTVPGSYPGQDGTVISFVRIVRESGPDPMRLVWRGDRLVGAGGDEGLRAPTTTLAAVDRDRAARFEPSTGRTTLVTVHGARVEVSLGDRTLVATRDETDPVPPPTRSLTRALARVFLTRGPDAGLERLARLRESAPEAYDFGEDALNRLGYDLLHAHDPPSAVAVFRVNAEDHPQSWNVFDSLGEALLAAGDVAEARAAYAESLRLNPDNETARRVLEETGARGPGGR